MKAIAVIIIGCILFSGTCFAHQDRFLTVRDDGVLEGLPPKYGPATLRIEFGPRNANNARSNISITLTLGKNQVRIPKCVTGWLRTQRMGEIRASASWYHEEEILPYYLNVDFFDPGYKKFRYANSGFSLLFNLHTAKLMQMEIIIVRDNGETIQRVPVDLGAGCSMIEFKGFSSDELRYRTWP